MSSNRFVNPYTFAPLPVTVLRRQPPGHDGSSERVDEPLYSGTLNLTWTLQTPFLLPTADSPTARGPEPVAGHGPRPGLGTSLPRLPAVYTIPGSSVKGALRSVHETLFAGCLRVFDGDFIPGYRHAAKPLGHGWHLGIVVEDCKGLPQRIQLCGPADEVDWVDGPSLARAYTDFGLGELPRSGDRLQLTGIAEWTTLQRSEIRDADTITEWYRPSGGGSAGNPGASRVLLVSSVGARREARRNGGRGRCLWALGTWTRHVLDVDEAAVSDYRAACQGSDDRRRLLSPVTRRKSGYQPTAHDDPTVREQWDARSQYDRVAWWPTYSGPATNFSGARRPIAERRLTTGLLFKDDVVWVRVAGTTIDAISDSQIWRSVGREKMASRVPRAALPCTDPGLDASAVPGAGLCLSCEIFGSADEGGSDNRIRGGRSEQHSYAGHIRFGTATSTTELRASEVDLAPLGSPHPGAGMFYLEDRPLSADRPLNDLPGQWGSSPDSPTPRSMRGRKYYWHSDPDIQAAALAREWRRPALPRYQRRPDQRQAAETRYLLPAGSTFTQTLTVDGISATGLQTLVATLQLHRVLDAAATYAHHLGGGKPLGLGTAIVEISSSEIQVLRDRYTGGDAVTVEDLDLRAATQRLDKDAAAALRLVLNPQALGDDAVRVTYPTTEGWQSYGQQRFDESFRYFTTNTGQRLKNGDAAWAPLPDLVGGGARGEARRPDLSLPTSPARPSNRYGGRG